MISLRDPTAALSDLVDSGQPTSIRVPDGQRAIANFLVARGLLKRAHEVSSATCSVCGGSHGEDVSADNPGWYVCPYAVGSTMAKPSIDWRTDWAELSKYLREQLCCFSQARHPLPGSLAFLGKMGRGSSSFPVWLARGLLIASERDAVLDYLEREAFQQAGVVVTANRHNTRLRFPHGSVSIWLADLLEVNDAQVHADPGVVFRIAAAISAPSAQRGRPKAAFDAVGVFLKRVQDGSAHRTIGAEAKALHIIETGKACDGRPSRIERQIRPQFRRWERSGFRPDFAVD